MARLTSTVVAGRHGCSLSRQIQSAPRVRPQAGLARNGACRRTAATVLYWRLLHVECPVKVYLIVVDAMADWEIAYLTAELHSRRFFADPDMDFRLVTAGLDRSGVVSMGGIGYVPDMAIGAIELDKDDLLVLPGSEIWNTPRALPALHFAREALDSGRRVAAICGATVGLAKVGALDKRRHTSNAPGLLKQACPGYRGEAYYRNEPAVRGDNLITASGLAPLEFSYEVFKMLKVWRPETCKAWFRLHKTRQERWYHELVASMTPDESA